MKQKKKCKARLLIFLLLALAVLAGAAFALYYIFTKQYAEAALFLILLAVALFFLHMAIDTDRQARNMRRLTEEG